MWYTVKGSLVFEVNVMLHSTLTVQATGDYRVITGN